MNLVQLPARHAVSSTKVRLEQKIRSDVPSKKRFAASGDALNSLSFGGTDTRVSLLDGSVYDSVSSDWSPKTVSGGSYPFYGLAARQSFSAEQEEAIGALGAFCQGCTLAADVRLVVEFESRIYGVKFFRVTVHVRGELSGSYILRTAGPVRQRQFFRQIVPLSLLESIEISSEGIPIGSLSLSYDVLSSLSLRSSGKLDISTTDVTWSFAGSNGISYRRRELTPTSLGTQSQLSSPLHFDPFTMIMERNAAVEISIFPRLHVDLQIDTYLSFQGSFSLVPKFEALLEEASSQCKFQVPLVSLGRILQTRTSVDSLHMLDGYDVVDHRLRLALPRLWSDPLHQPQADTAVYCLSLPASVEFQSDGQPAYSWATGPWSACNKDGTRDRKVWCSARSVVLSFPDEIVFGEYDDLCPKFRPPTVESCNSYIPNVVNQCGIRSSCYDCLAFPGCGWCEEAGICVPSDPFVFPEQCASVLLSECANHNEVPFSNFQASYGGPMEQYRIALTWDGGPKIGTIGIAFAYEDPADSGLKRSVYNYSITVENDVRYKDSRWWFSSWFSFEQENEGFFGANMYIPTSDFLRFMVFSWNDFDNFAISNTLAVEGDCRLNGHCDVDDPERSQAIYQLPLFSDEFKASYECSVSNPQCRCATARLL